MTEPYPIGGPQHLFLDDFLIERMTRLRRRVQQPVTHPANPVVTRDYPWESLRAHIYGGVLYDAERQRFRMWYMPYGPEWKPSRTAYAESADGVHWVKPMLPYCPFPGYDRTNIVLAPPGGTNEIGVFEDPHETDPRRRFKAMFDTYTAAGRVQRVAFSPDGLQWDPPEGMQVLAGKKDSGISVFWSEKLQRYLAFVRAYDPDPREPLPPLGVFRLRTHAYTESRDFLKWTEPVTVFRTDERDGIGGTVQVYGMGVTPLGDQFIGLVCLLRIHEMVYEHHPRELRAGWDGGPPERPLETGVLDVQLAVSRDGRDWTRVGNRETFMPRGRPGAWDAEEVRTMQNFLVHDDTIYIYYLGSSHPHATGSPGAIGLATLPADRFVSVEPLFAAGSGVLETRPITAPSGRLLLNAEVSRRGSLQVEVLDAGGEVLQGFDAGSSWLRRHDTLRHEAVWSAGGHERRFAALPRDAAGRRLRFLIGGEARLFAFQVVEL